MSETSNAASRIPKACQECRKRKIRCNGVNPCKACQQRNSACVYREFTRHRRRKPEYQEAQQNDHTGQRRHSLASSQSAEPNSSAMHHGNFPNSVSATHMASPSCQIQLYYGPTTHFSLMQHAYRDLVANPVARSKTPSGQIEEAGEALDLFNFRRIFFGTPDTHSGGKGPSSGDMSLMFLPFELAKLFLSRFLSTLYQLTPFRPPVHFEQGLDQLYHPPPDVYPDSLSQASSLLALAIGSLGTEHYTWGDVLFERVKALLTAFDDVVNLETVQISLLMISFIDPFIPEAADINSDRYAHFQGEQGRPNSTFLYIGSAVRKAYSMGLHKDAHSNNVQSKEGLEERRITFWSLYFFETWFCFHLGRPSSMSLKDTAIDYASDPFIRLLVHLCKAISRSANQIYGQRHESLLHMLRVARSISHDLQDIQAQMKLALGSGHYTSVAAGSLGVQQIICAALSYHTLLLTFRPFLVFRGHWKRDIRMARHPPSNNGSNHPTETPSWLNESCNYALIAAQKTIRHICEASNLNDYIKQLRYHGYFLGSACFTLIYDMIHDESTAAAHLPWIYAALQNLSTMRAGDPITNTISAIQTVLRKINPSYEWSPYPKEGPPSLPQAPAHGHDEQTNMLDPAAFSLEADLSNIQPSLPTPEMLETELLDFTQSDIRWNFDFSTMDLEAFFSINQPIAAPMP